jgi:hypothetical protein
MVPSLLCGIATIPSAWWIARRWFGPEAGCAVMWLVALNEFHAAYSRTALTDVPVTLAILWAVFAAWKLLLNPTIKAGLLTGGLTAIAWWLKYSGWLPLAILLVGGMVFQCLVRPEDRRWKPWAFATGVAILTAAVLWIPVYRDCLAVGGYGAVATNHRGYILGWSHWWIDFVRQAESFGVYFRVTGFALVWAMIPPYLRAFRSSTAKCLIMALAFSPIGYVLFLPSGFWFHVLALAVVAIAFEVRDWQQGRLSNAEIAAGALVTTWFCGLLVTTPLYHPYPRLLLPWWLAASLLGAWSIARLNQLTSIRVDRAVSRSRPTSWRMWIHEVCQNPRVLVVAIFAVIGFVMTGPENGASEVRRGTRDAAMQIADQLRPHSDTAIVSVYGQPAAVLALRELGVAAVVSAGPEAAARLDGSWLVVSSDADRDSTWNENWPKVADRFELVSTFPTNPSSIVLLDQGPMPTAPPDVGLRLYRRR